MSQVVQEERTVGDVISNAFALLKRLFMFILPIVALFQVGNALLHFFTRPENANQYDLVVDFAFNNDALLPSVILFLLNIIVYAFIMFSAKAVAMGKPLSYGIQLRQAFEKIVPLMIAGIIVGVLTYFTFYLFVLPSMIIYLLFFLYTPAIVLDDQSGLTSLKTSARLVMRSLFHVLGVLISVYLIYYVIRWLATGIGFVVPDFISGIIFWLVATAFGVFFPCLEFVLYNDLKSRHKGHTE